MSKKYSRAYVEITNICNKNCSFCPKTKRAPARMELDSFKRVADSIRPLTDYIYYHVMGEPLTHPLLPEFIRYASSLGLKSAVTTNGTLLEKQGEELIKSGVYKVSISLHGFEEGSEEEQSHYVNSCLDFADKASKSGVLTVLRLWNKGAADTKNALTEKIIGERLGEPESVSARGARYANKLHLEYGDRFIWPDTEAESLGDRMFCYGLSDHFGVLCDGSVIPCCLDHEGDITLGNIFTEDIEKILASERAEAIRLGFQRKTAWEELCKKCSYARRFKI